MSRTKDLLIDQENFEDSQEPYIHRNEDGEFELRSIGENRIYFFDKEFLNK